MKQFESRLKELLSDQELLSFLQSLDREPRKSLRLNPLRPSPALEVGEKIEWCDRGYFFDMKMLGTKPNLHPALLSGSAFIQEAGAMEVVEHLDIKPGMNVLDLCAAPGAKSTQIGEHLKGKGWLVANEVVRDRSRVLDALLMRHGISNSAVYSLKPHELVERFEGKFDRILADAPCSGESLFAKRAEKRKDVSHKEVKQCQKRQLSILDSGAKMLREGGKMIYSTCTYARNENEDVVAEFLKGHAEFDLVSEHRRWPHKDGVPGGYFAVLSKKGSGESRVMGDRDFFKNTNGLLRAGLKRWDGSTDLYGSAMDAFGTFSAEGDYEIQPSEIQKFFRETPHLKDRKEGFYRLVVKENGALLVLGVIEVLKNKTTLRVPTAVR